MIGDLVKMRNLPAHLTPEAWTLQVFTSREALTGGVVKRKIRDVERLAGRDRFLYAAKVRGFQVVENGRHFVVFCNESPIRRVGHRQA